MTVKRFYIAYASFITEVLKIHLRDWKAGKGICNLDENPLLKFEVCANKALTLYLETLKII